MWNVVVDLRGVHAVFGVDGFVLICCVSTRECCVASASYSAAISSSSIGKALMRSLAKNLDQNSDFFRVLVKVLYKKRSFISSLAEMRSLYIPLANPYVVIIVTKMPSRVLVSF